MPAPTMEQFKATVEERMRPGFRYEAATVERFREDQASFDLRLEGGYITSCYLLNSSDTPTQILYKPPDLSVAELDASHAMSPVGPFEGLGGQHGFARWADYAPDVIEKKSSSTLVWSNTPVGQPLLGRSAEFLGKNSVRFTTELHNTSDQLETPVLLKTSLGDNLYFSLPGGNAGGLRIGADQASLAEPAELAEIMEGNAQLWAEYNGQAFVDFPDGQLIKIDTDILYPDIGKYRKVPLGLLLWHRPGTESICIAPTLGYGYDAKGRVRNDLLKLAAGAAIALETDIRLLS